MSNRSSRPGFGEARRARGVRSLPPSEIA